MISAIVTRLILLTCIVATVGLSAITIPAAALPYVLVLNIFLASATTVSFFMLAPFPKKIDSDDEVCYAMIKAPNARDRYDVKILEFENAKDRADFIRDNTPMAINATRDRISDRIHVMVRDPDLDAVVYSGVEKRG